jgi:hypothetical protein
VTLAFFFVDAGIPTFADIPTPEVPQMHVLALVAIAATYLMPSSYESLALLVWTLLCLLS